MKWQKITRGLSPLRIVGQFFRHHPWALCLLIFLVILYKYFFSWFTALVTTSPVFIIAGIFFGIIQAYDEPNNPEKDHTYKKIEKTDVQNALDSGKSVGVSLPRIPSSEEIVPKQETTRKKTRKITPSVSSSETHGVGCSSEPGSSESTGGSDADTTPMLHAFHHLSSASNSSHSSQDGDFSDSSMQGGTENQERSTGDVPEGKKDGKSVAWTSDDQKNILKIGSLEIERNQRLESLIATRRTRNYSDRNLIDFGNCDSLPSVEELSKFNVQIPAVFAPRNNPFDLPYNEDNFPDSAPSALLQTRNPFDLPCLQEDVSILAEGAGPSVEEPICVVSLLQKSALFRRHLSFTNGVPFHSEFLQDRRPSRFRSHFVTEKMATEGMPSSSLEGETTEKSSSKESSGQDSDSTSSVMDIESHKDVLEDCSNRQQPSCNQVEEEARVAQHVRHVSLVLHMDPPALISDSSDDDTSLSGEHINDWVGAQYGKLNFPQNSLLEDHSVTHQGQEIEMTHNGLHQMSPCSNYAELTSSSSSESTDDPFKADDIKASCDPRA